MALVGPRGAGKTTLGIALAVRLGWVFADGDHRVARAVGEPAGAFLQRRGEAAFRVVEERETLAALAGPGVLATGGGAILSPAVRAALQGPGVFTVYLRASPEVLVARLRGSRVHRPALTQHPLEVEVREILERRQSLYEQAADLTLEMGAANVDSCCRSILATMRTAL